VVVYAALFALVFAESAAFLGLLVPGELALAAAGALSVAGDVSLGWVLGVAFVAAVLGQAVAFVLGRRLGPRMIAAAEARPRIARDLPVARHLLLARGARVVVASRWVGALRALVPMLAGASGFPARRFMVAQTAAAAIWVGAVVAVGRVAAQGAADPHGWLLWISVGVGAAVTAGIYLAWRRAIGRPVPRVAVGAAVAGALGIATALVLLRAAGPRALEQVLGRVDGWALAGAIGLQLVSTATLTQVYRATYAANGGRLRYRDALTLTLGAFSLMQLLPAGGAAGGLFAMRRLGAHGADAVAACKRSRVRSMPARMSAARSRLPSMRNSR
jgi:membrane-associated protein